MSALYKEEEVLGAYEERFYNDFDYDDIKELLENLLTRDEIKQIDFELTNEEKIQKLFFLLIYRKKKIQIFLATLGIDYDWLANDLRNALENRTTANVEIDVYRRAIRDIPMYDDFLIHRCDLLWKAIKELKSLSREQTLVLHGKKGIGKRWLAADACRNFSVVRKMNNQIFWINASKCKTLEDDLDKLVRLKILLGDDNDIDSKVISTSNISVKNEIIRVRNQVRRIMEQNQNYKNCLVVLVDVRQQKTLEAFKLPCKILVTTRHTEITNIIPTERKKMLNIGEGFTYTESLQMMTKALHRKETVLLPDEELKCRQLYDLSHGNPFIMSIICKNFMDNETETAKSREKRFDSWIDRMNNYDITDDNFKIPIQETLRQLPEGFENLFNDLVIFHDNVNIPLSTLKNYWQRSDHETEEIVKKFYNNSLLEYCNRGSLPVTWMHYVYNIYLKTSFTGNHVESCHRRLIESYKVEDTLRNRKELDLDFPNDEYFHYYIGYHIKEACMENLFPELYLDFGFLEQKLKYSGLPNTIGDLNTYAQEIIGNCSERGKFLSALMEFLPSTEEVILKSSDTTLLQYALTSSNSFIKEQAIKIASKFPDRLWFHGIDHSSKQTQIIRTPDVPQFVKFYDHERVMIHMDSTISIQDLNVEYSHTPKCYKADYKLVDLQILEDYGVFFTQDDSGILRAYQLFTLNGSVSTYQHNSVQFDFPNNRLDPLCEYEKKINCFCVIKEDGSNDDQFVKILVNLTTGAFRILKWIRSKNFQDLNWSFPLKVQNLKHITFNYLDANPFIMLLNESGCIQFINLRTLQDVPFTNAWSKHGEPINVHTSRCPNTGHLINLCVFKSSVVQIVYEKYLNGFILCTNFSVIYETASDNNEILCSALSEDSVLLVLGTKRGIIAFDRIRKMETLRSHVGEEIISVDIRLIDEHECHSILISVFNNSEQIVNLRGILRTQPLMHTQSIQWDPIDGESRSDGGSSHGSISMSSDIFCRFLGDANLFDVWKEPDHLLSMVLVDDRNRIHFRDSTDDFSQTNKRVQFEHIITEICKHRCDTFVGCQEGYVFQLGNEMPVMQLESSVSYLESVMGEFVVAGSESQYKIFGLDKTFQGKLFKCFLMSDGMLICVKNSCAIDFVDAKTGDFTVKDVRRYKMCVAAACHDGILLVATNDNLLFICQISVKANAIIDVDSQQAVLDYMETQEDKSSQISALAVSKDKSFYAVGYETGMIELYNMKTKMLINRLESHKHKICCLKFSPWNSSNDPIILVSLAEQIVFWNVSHIHNNPNRPDRTKEVRRSQRFSRVRRVSTSTEDAVDASPNLFRNGKILDNPWIGKVGASDKVEVLSCIKFVGNRAFKFYHNDNFTVFCTVDNDGTIYYLRLMENKELVDNLRENLENSLSI